MIEEEKWVLPERLRAQEAAARTRLEKGLPEADSDFAAYYLLRKGDAEAVRPHAIAREVDAKAYVLGLLRLLRQEGYALGQNVLDAGCGPGCVTHALHEASGAKLLGVDISQDAIGYARGKWSDCEFVCASLDELDLREGSLSAIHAREFYPFTRVTDREFMIAYLGRFHRFLEPGGVLVFAQADIPKGLSAHWKDIQGPVQSLGFEPIRRFRLIARQLTRIAGPSAYKPVVRQVLTSTTRILASARGSHQQNCFVIRKSDGGSS